MSVSEDRMLPKEKAVRISEGKPAICDVSGFLSRVNECIRERMSPEDILVYRGEPEVYDKPCRPNIFRRGVLSGNRFFEKNLFDAMRQNKLSGEERYLDNAIDAQHGEFPSRLLDVSYNCLTALYFAVTPYYHKDEDSKDEQDGMVYIFFFDELFSPSAGNTNAAYEAMIRQDREWYQGKSLFEKNHKFIDHTKLNNRIVAQQGAFILFPGMEPESLPECMYCGIRIPGEAKPRIRQELKQLFGIHTGSIYPEIINLVEELSSKSRKINTEEFTCRNELRQALRLLERELGYYLEYALEQKRGGADHMEQILMHIERVTDSYRTGILEVLREAGKPAEEGQELLSIEERKATIAGYNQLVEQFSQAAKSYDLGEFSGDALQIYVNEGESSGSPEEAKEEI